MNLSRILSIIVILVITQNTYARPIQKLLDAIAEGEERAYKADPQNKSHLTNDYNRSHLKLGGIDFYRYSEKENAHFVGITGGVHLGTLYIAFPKTNAVYRLDCGPIYGIVSLDEISPTEDGKQHSEFFILTSTGGTGVHEIYGELIQIKDNKVQEVFCLPIKRTMVSTYHDNMIPFGYEITRYSISSTGLELYMKYYFHFPEGLSQKEKAGVLKQQGLRTGDESFTIIIKNDRSVVVEASSKGLTNNALGEIRDMININHRGGQRAVEVFTLPIKGE